MESVFKKLNYKQKIEQAQKPIVDSDLIIRLHLIITTLEESIEIESLRPSNLVDLNVTTRIISNLQSYSLVGGKRQKLSDTERCLIFIATSQAYWLSIVIRKGEIPDEELGVGFRKFGILPAQLEFDIPDYSLYDTQFSLLDLSKTTKFKFWTDEYCKVFDALKNKCYILANSCYITEDPKRLDAFDMPVFMQTEDEKYFVEEEKEETFGKKGWSIPNKFMISSFERITYYMSLKSLIFKTFPYTDKNKVFRPPHQILNALKVAVLEKAMDINISKLVDQIACKEVTNWLCTKMETESFVYGKVLEEESNTRRALETQNAEVLTEPLKLCMKNGSGLVDMFVKKLKVATIAQLTGVSEEDIITSEIFILLFDVWLSQHVEGMKFEVKKYITYYSQLIYPFDQNVELKNSRHPVIIKLPHGWGVWDFKALEIIVYSNVFEAAVVWLLMMELAVEDDVATIFWNAGLVETKAFLLLGTEWETKSNIRTKAEIPFYEKLGYKGDFLSRSE